MIDVNRVTLSGTVVGPIDRRETPRRTPVLSFRVRYAVTKKGQTTSGYIDVNCFQRLAEQAEKEVRAHRDITVTGRLNHREWIDRARDIPRDKTEIIAERLEFEGGIVCTFCVPSQPETPSTRA